MFRRSTFVATAMLALVVIPSLAHAQGAPRTWVSGSGNDNNPCTITAPCASFIAAMVATAIGGEISVLDAGSFGPVIANKSVTINGDGTLSAVLVVGQVGILVDAPPQSVVTLRNLSINCVGTGGDGVRYIAGGALNVEDVTISGCTGAGISANLTSNGNLTIVNSRIKGGVAGVRAVTTSGLLNVTLDNVSVSLSAKGIYAIQIGTKAVVRNSAFTQNTLGVLGESSGTVDVINSLISGNAKGVQAEFGGLVRLSANNIFENAAGFVCGTGVIQSLGNNSTGGNGAGCGFAAGFVVQ